jgi:hypothetical protein
MMFPRIPALAFAFAAFAVPSMAQTSNPLGPTLPLTVHTLANCVQVNNQSPTSLIDEHVGAAHASCTAGTTADASADVSAGSLRAVVATQWLDPVYQAGLAKVALYDTLTFAGLTGSAVITLNMSIHGRFSGPPSGGGGDVYASLISDFPPLGIHVAESNSGDIYLPEGTVGGVTTNADPITGLFDRNDVRFDLSRSFAIVPGGTFWFLAQLNLFAGGTNEVTDFGHTALLSLDLPPGVTYTSSSGLFLTGVAAPVPEPETTWLLLAGLIPIAARLSWTRRHARGR